ncbi:hypothetical protein [Microbacterium testaceum]|uniref:GIY-YIG domain-containing protein n=1 Tax=Microbacterium testaceum TaxID=2033 RepID=A0A2T7VN59_MICTE|nr:hypothetical protein [Microbacterium testaceum]PVE58825.1 hypothetical protein DC432_15465 [Microbacterium testaceum]
MEHFGVRVQRGPKNGLRLVREEYARISKTNTTWFPRERFPKLWEAQADNFEDADHRILSDEWCQRHRALALENFDLNMQFFERLDRGSFEAAVARMLETVPGLTEIYDLGPWEKKAGLYVMVLDEYKQMYVGHTGAANGVKARIRQHWSSSKAFDRLLWGTVEGSILSIDSFRALDTTRIFVAKPRNRELAEAKLIRAIGREFLANRVYGGSPRLVTMQAALGDGLVFTRDLADDGVIAETDGG